MDAGQLAPPVSPPLRVVVDATEIVREGVGALLRDHADRVVLMSHASRERPDVGLFDPVTQPRSTIRTASNQHAPLVALVWDETVRSTTRARLLGASQILRISAPAADVLAALERAHRDWTVPQRPRGNVLLTRREEEILSMICRGHTNTEIADQLFLSINSVKTYIRSAYRKMGVTRRSRAVLWGIDHGY